jgi:hypothetical protein
MLKYFLCAMQAAASTIAVALLSLSMAAFARDPDGKYAKANPEMAKWFKQLRSPAGAACCAVSDGNTLQDTDWRSKDGHYQVLFSGEWVDVPENAVIAEPNLYGRTVVWPYYEDGHPTVRCFLPGSMM